MLLPRLSALINELIRSRAIRGSYLRLKLGQLSRQVSNLTDRFMQHT